MTEKIIKWRSVKKDGLPDKSGIYLIYRAKRNYCTHLQYSAKHRAFNSYDAEKEATCALSVDYWCPIDEILPEEAANEKAD